MSRMQVFKCKWVSNESSIMELTLKSQVKAVGVKVVGSIKVHQSIRLPDKVENERSQQVGHSIHL